MQKKIEKKLLNFIPRKIHITAVTGLQVKCYVPDAASQLSFQASRLVEPEMSYLKLHDQFSSSN